MYKIVSIILIVATILIAVVFAILNSTPVAVDFLAATFTVPVSVVIMISLIVGCLMGLLVAGWIAARRYGEMRALRRRLALADEELAKLRKLPIKDAW